jgi:hypothetical protein
MPSASFRWSFHALIEAGRRRIARDVVEQVVWDPQQVVMIDDRREIRQSIDEAGALVRVIVDIENDPVVIVTAYRTSKVAKYWRGSP